MKRVAWITFLILTAVSVCSGQTTFYYPHVANGVLGGGVWKTTILLTNPAASGAASGTITLTKDNSASATAGSPFSEIAFVDQDGAPAANGGIITFSIPGGQTRKYTSTGAGPYLGGFATVATTTGTVSGTAIFSQFDGGGRLIAEAGVPSASAVPNQAIFVDTIGGYNIGVAYANPGAAGANITLSLLNSSAASVATTTQVLGPGNHASSFTFQMFPGSPQIAGTMQVRSSAPLAAVAIRFDPSLTVFTTLPPVTLASLVSPAVKWLEQRPWFAPLTSVARLLAAFQLRVG
jgi:hypothetical protein